MAVYILGCRLQVAGGRYTAPNPQPPTPNLNRKGQLNFGFIVALLLLVILVISVTSGVLNLLPSVKHDAGAAEVQARAIVISKMLLESPGNPADWSGAGVVRIGLAHYDSFKNISVLGRLNSTKLDYAKTLSYDTIADQLGIGNETSFRLRVDNGTTILDINNSRPSPSSSVFVLHRIFAIDSTSYGNVTLEVWQ